MTTAPEPPHQVVDRVLGALQKLQQTLQGLNLSEMEQAVAELQVAMLAVERFPGGADGLRTEIESLPEQDRDSLLEKLKTAKHLHATNQTLITLAIQRNAAAQAYLAQNSAAAVYSNEGGVPATDMGSLLGRF
jgi:hypothetical protein